jgi:hypothetical protein
VLVLLWYYFMRSDYQPTLGSVLVPFVLTAAVLVLFHVLTHLLLPMRWPAIRGNFRTHLDAAIRDHLDAAYLGVPAAVADELAAERRRVDALADQLREIQALLERRREAARIDALYGISTGG